jgi:transcriptional regulator with XRE-family HTH domain
METIRTFLRPVIDLQGTGAQIKRLRQLNGFSVHDVQSVFGFDYPQAIYGWESGKNIPTIDNLLVLAQLFNVEIGDLIVTKTIEVDSVPENIMKSA